MDAHSGGMSGSTSNSKLIKRSLHGTIPRPAVASTFPEHHLAPAYPYSHNRIIAACLGFTFMILLSLGIAIYLTRRYRADRKRKRKARNANANANVDVEAEAEARKAADEHPRAEQENENPFADPHPIRPGFVYRLLWRRGLFQRNPFHDRNAVTPSPTSASASANLKAIELSSLRTSRLSSSPFNNNNDTTARVTDRTLLSARGAAEAEHQIRVNERMERAFGARAMRAAERQQEAEREGRGRRWVFEE